MTMKRWACLAVVLCCLLGGCLSLAEDTALQPEEIAASLANGNAAGVAAHFTDEMKAVLSAEDLATVWAQLEAQCGAYLGMSGEVRSTSSGAYTVLQQVMEMEQMNLLLVVSLDAEQRIAGLQFTVAPMQTAAPETSERCEEVTFGDDPWVLSGTLTLPDAQQPVPAVVLVHGSGPNDRYETLGATHLFADLAEALSARGIAVLQYDKRTYLYAQEMANDPDDALLTVEEEVIQDAIAAGRLLQADVRIDPDRVYVLGHSLGAMLAPRICAESEGVFAGMVLAGGSNESLLQILLRQLSDLAEQAGYEQLAPLLEQTRQTAARLTEMTAEEAAQTTDALAGSIYYYWEMAQHPTPAAYLNQLQLPTLIINGTRDFQVVQAEGRDSWEAALDMDAPWLHCFWPDVNHVLMCPEVDEQTAGTADEYAVPCTLEDEVAEKIATLILTNGGNKE